MDTTFSGRINWEGACVPQSMATDIIADAIEKSLIEKASELTGSTPSHIRELSYMLSCTRPPSITRKEGDADVLEVFAKTIGEYKSLPIHELWNWRLNMPYPLLNAWRFEFNKAQDMFPVDPAQLPLDVLTDDQREELKDKKSPLA